MKKIKYLLFIGVASMLMFSCVNAKVQTETLKEACKKEELTCDFKEKDTSKLPNLYVFRGEGCSHCRALITHLSTIYDDISDQVNIVIYEVGNNQDNWEFYEKVGAKFGDEVGGYPYIVIGKTVFDGYGADYDVSILKAIEKLANSEDAFDVVKELNNNNTTMVEKESLENKKETSEKNNSGLVIAFIFGVIVVVGAFTGYQISKK